MAEASKMSASELVARFPEVRKAVLRQHRNGSNNQTSVPVEIGTVTITPMRLDGQSGIVPDVRQSRELD